VRSHHGSLFGFDTAVISVAEKLFKSFGILVH